MPTCFGRVLFLFSDRWVTMVSRICSQTQRVPLFTDKRIVHERPAISHEKDCILAPGAYQVVPAESVCPYPYLTYAEPQRWAPLYSTQRSRVAARIAAVFIIWWLAMMGRSVPLRCTRAKVLRHVPPSFSRCIFARPLVQGLPNNILTLHESFNPTQVSLSTLRLADRLNYYSLPAVEKGPKI